MLEGFAVAIQARRLGRSDLVSAATTARAEERVFAGVEAVE